jgi:hypothetical protein
LITKEDIVKLSKIVLARIKLKYFAYLFAQKLKTPPASFNAFLIFSFELK